MNRFKNIINKEISDFLEEDRVNPHIEALLMSDKNFPNVLKYIHNWFAGKIGYIEPRQRELFKDLTIKEIKKLLDGLNVGYGTKE